MDINVQMTRHGPADLRRSAYEPLLFCLSFILTAAWGIVV